MLNGHPSISGQSLNTQNDGHASGVVYFAESSGIANIEVELRAFYESEDALQRRAVCALRRSQGEFGIGIFTSPKHQGAWDNLALEITVWLPGPPSEVDVVFIPLLGTDLPNFHHVIGDLPTHVFGLVELSSTNAPIEVGCAEKTQIIMSNRYIRGKFDVSSSLELATTHEFISAEISAYNDNDCILTDVIFSTTNAYGLFSTKFANFHKWERIKRSFRVMAHSSNSLLEIRFTEQALDSILDQDVRSTDGISNVYLHPVYEGSFELLPTTTLPSCT
ncbi:hypothetical protein B0F90DRAFT_1885702 [Multifurca ochricompacta]|uniref:Uncharacterized protein n=1 Tax=Multifurca ochricompacta TaxID=376703 RepID=A0AAD4M924_9AGAM|nr:hypothetical protein B0F90DRAFT_1885702 [Multifurca ochricompacta]